MTVVVIDSLKGSDVESYANSLFRQWGLGQKGKDNGVLILLSIKDRKWRVEVGRGLEGRITDIYSSRVMDDIAKPLLKEEKYGEAMKKAYSVFADDVAKEYNVTLEKNEKVKVPQKDQERRRRYTSYNFHCNFVKYFWWKRWKTRKKNLYLGSYISKFTFF